MLGGLHVGMKACKYEIAHGLLSFGAGAILILRASSRGKRTWSGVCGGLRSGAALRAARAGVAACGVICGLSMMAGERGTALGMGFNLGYRHACTQAWFYVRP